MKNEFVIKINKDSKGNPVSLDNIPIEAADALKIFLESLSDFAKLHSNISDVKLSLTPGSICSALTYPSTETRFDNEIHDVIEGKSENNENIKLLKTIQDKIKLNGLDYTVLHKVSDVTHDLTSKFKAKNFSYKRGPRNDWYKDILFIEGDLFAAGGKSIINIHVETQDKFVYTIDCSREQAKNLNEFLYEKVFLCVLRKYKPNKKNEHELIDFYFKKDKYFEYKSFYERLKSITTLERFDIIHDKIVEIIENDYISNGELLKLLRPYNYEENDRGILRTILMTLKPIDKDDKLLELYRSIGDKLRIGNSSNAI